MNVRALLQTLRTDPKRYLECPCPESLGAFLGGYVCVDDSLGLAWKFATDTDRLDGPAEMGLFSRAYLSFEDTSEGMVRVLQLLEEVLPVGPISPLPGPHAHRSFPPLVMEAFDQRRLGLVLREPTISCLFHTYQGHLVGTEAIAPQEAGAQQHTLRAFEAWLREEYEHPHAGWHRILRVYGGESLAGVQKFVELWREFEGREARTT
jgi:hypothetical protein